MKETHAIIKLNFFIYIRANLVDSLIFWKFQKISEQLLLQAINKLDELKNVTEKNDLIYDLYV